MKRLCSALWEMVRSHIGDWFFGGAVSALIGASPDEWFEKLFRATHVPVEAIHLWSLGVDLRWVFLAAGGAVMVADVVAHLRPHGSGDEGGTHPVAVNVAPQISMAPQVIQAPQNTFAPQITVNVPSDARSVAITQATSSHSETGKCVVLPYPSLGALFKGRDAFLLRLRASLTRPDGGTAAIAGRAVHGLGGVGKTRAAVEYAWAHRAEYTALALLDAETGEKLHASLAALVGPLRLPEQAVPEESARMEAALAWLNANPRWFLILDNIDTEPALDAANRLLGRLQGGHVVMTSRLARFPRGVERLDLDVLSLDDAATFLLEATEGGRRKAADDTEQARVLAEELGSLR